eukprot:SM000108S14214  [mRNA]  locus=s108:219662:221627:- [translate_table: standard]
MLPLLRRAAGRGSRPAAGRDCHCLLLERRLCAARYLASLPDGLLTAATSIRRELQRGPLEERLHHQQRRHILSWGDGDEDAGDARHYEEERILGYSPTQLFDVVSAVDLYEDFVPWCQRSNVIWKKGDEMDAELEIGFKLFRERYISHVRTTRPSLVKTTVSQSTLFDHLDNMWEFRPGPAPGTTNLHFAVDFRFKSALYRRAADLFFDEVVSRLVGSFERRCLVVYGPGVDVRRLLQSCPAR